MKKIIAALALAGLLLIPAEAAVQLAGSNELSRRASVPGDVSVLVLVRDASGKNLFRNVRESVASTALGVLAATGAQTQSLETLTTRINSFPGKPPAEKVSFSPAEAMEITGADYALVLQLAAPVETFRSGTVYARQNVFYTLFSADGKAVASGKVAKIFDAPSVDDALREIRVCSVAEMAVAELEEKIASGKLVLEKMSQNQLGETELVAVVETVRFPQLVENKDGTFSVVEGQGAVSLPGISLKIGGLNYTLAADGSPTTLKLPLCRTLLVSAKHRNTEPLNFIVKLEKSGEQIVLPLKLSKAARERWEKDSAEISAIIASEKIAAADANRIREIVKYWEGSGMKMPVAPKKTSRDAEAKTDKEAE